jgi:hypothetical protein
MKDIRNGELSARDRAACANALDKILERKRILRMKPAPKAVDADKYEEQRKCARRRELPEPKPIETHSPPSPTEEYESQPMPGFPGAHLMVKKSPPGEPQAYSPENRSVEDTFKPIEANNRDRAPKQAVTPAKPQPTVRPIYPVGHGIVRA